MPKEEEKTDERTGTHATSREEDARLEDEGVNQRKTEETSRKAAVMERSREAELSAKADTRPEDANTARHFPGCG
ncbi:hypothetical protein NDU88_003100 [Pleurodeles waltl]|uniref:Uncharacterized protein n=1 Tax=Pleurodeles waltl TaxID=8319 RepID=A0AAV7KXZ7_PLEWA|nr:hypothetical protein NDU88_003100 [Pleurodeles waltl]